MLLRAFNAWFIEDIFVKVNVTYSNNSLKARDPYTEKVASHIAN